METTIPILTNNSILRTKCPYCGGTAELREYKCERVQFTVECLNSACSVQPTTMSFYDPKHAIFVWDGWQRESFCQPLPPVGIVDIE